MDLLQKRLANLLTIKSIVTLVLTAVFAVLSVRGEIDSDFLTIFAVIISFYFGTQSEKKSRDGEAAPPPRREDGGRGTE